MIGHSSLTNTWKMGLAVVVVAGLVCFQIARQWLANGREEKKGEGPCERMMKLGKSKIGREGGQPKQKWQLKEQRRGQKGRGFVVANGYHFEPGETVRKAPIYLGWLHDWYETFWLKNQAPSEREVERELRETGGLEEQKEHPKKIKKKWKETSTQLNQIQEGLRVVSGKREPRPNLGLKQKKDFLKCWTPLGIG